ncbi:hypothetical protein [Planctomicrobium piriforme]|uniref:Uncharacterized protein n=1 Tax=Planctomicrobium piriforme TaxID=1576369 RepID=A0A1I3QVW6_9PLAN|nr:hypothetical protein [Planctomicrobium piriforme]SFJ37247.1 hypothetical protein SAMN05421753_11940 [Planctomicrobium piriforme]
MNGGITPAVPNWAAIGIGEQVDNARVGLDALSSRMTRAVMSAHFAGSAHVGGRRRRRLAQEAVAERVASPGGRAARASRDVDVPVVSETLPVRRRASLVPRTWWLIGGLAALNLIVCAALLWLGISGWAEQRGLQELLDLNHGPALRYYSLVQLLIASQLSFLIYWHRSQSRKDFMGRYRVWGWAGVFWGVVCLARATGTQLDMVQALLARVQLDAWRPETVSWLLPLSVGYVALYRLLRRELRLSRPSLMTWEFTFGLGLIGASLVLGLDSLLPISVRSPLVIGIGMLWQAGVVATCLFQVRYVVHVTNEAAPRLPSRGTQLSRWLHHRFTLLGERVLTLPALRAIRWQRLVKDADATAVAPPAKKRRSTRATLNESASSEAEAAATERATVVTKKAEKKAAAKVDVAAEPKAASASWLKRLPAWGKRKELSQDETPVAAPAKTMKPEPAPVAEAPRRPAPATPVSAVKPPRETESKPKQPTVTAAESGTDAKPEAKSAGWLSGLGAWRKADGKTTRVDATVEQAAPKPHVPAMTAKPSRPSAPEPKRPMTPVAAPVKPVAQAAPVVAAKVVPPKAMPAPIAQQQSDDDEDAGDDRLSSRERKKLKKQQRLAR